MMRVNIKINNYIQKPSTALLTILLIFPFVFIVTSCEGLDLDSDPIEASEIPGKYIASYNDDRLHEYIELKKDSTYIHYTKFDTLEYHDTGSYRCWRDIPYNKYHISFDRSFVRRFSQTYDYKYSPQGKVDTTWISGGWGTYIKKGIKKGKIIIEFTKYYTQYYYKFDSKNKE